MISMSNYDIIIIGAGVFGLSTAYHIKSQHPEKKILVLDKQGGPGQGNSAKSACAFRNVFASETNYLLSNSTIDFFKHIHNDLNYDLGLRFTGYLWLLNNEQYNDQKTVFQKMHQQGVQLKTFEKEDLNKSFKGLSTDFNAQDEEAQLLGLKSIDKGIQGLKCGSIDGDRLARFYEEQYRKLGGETRYNTEVTKLTLKPRIELGLPGEPFVWQDASIQGVETLKGDQISAEKTIVAAGAWASTLLNPVGLDSFMNPKKRQIFVFKHERLKDLFSAHGFNNEGVIPFTILPRGGIYLKPEISEQSIWIGCADNLGRAFLYEDDPKPEPSYYTGNLYYILSKYLPCFTDLQPVNMWAGSYALNSIDKVPYVFEEAGMIYVGADSGSGLMKCDAIGRIAAALYSNEKQALLYKGESFRVSDLSVKNRNIEKETMVI